MFCYSDLISLMEIVKAKEAFPFVIQPKGKKPLGRNSFIIRLYLGCTYDSLCIYKYSIECVLIGSSNADQQQFPLTNIACQFDPVVAWG